jgi:hypothetical protein
MNKLLVISNIVFAATSACAISMAGDVFDSPGPAYYQQINRVFSKRIKDVPNHIHLGAPIIHSTAPSFPPADLPNLEFFPAAKLLEPNDPTSSRSSSPSFLRELAELMRFSIENTGYTFSGYLRRSGDIAR